MKPHDFSSLCKSALTEWPETVNLLEVQYLDGDRYSVLGLGRQLEEIEHRHIGSTDEVILRELHWAIYTVIHSLAKNLSELRPSAVRAEAVQRIFERRLQTAIASKDPAWNAGDFALAQAYLQAGD